MGVPGIASGGCLTDCQIIASPVVMTFRHSAFCGKDTPRPIGFENNAVLVQNGNVRGQGVEDRNGQLIGKQAAGVGIFLPCILRHLKASKDVGGWMQSK